MDGTLVIREACESNHVAAVKASLLVSAWTEEALMPKYTPSRSWSSTQSVSPMHTKPAHAKDVETMDAIIESMYAVISGACRAEAHLPGAHLILAVVRKGENAESSRAGR